MSVHVRTSGCVPFLGQLLGLILQTPPTRQLSSHRKVPTPAWAEGRPSSCSSGLLVAQLFLWSLSRFKSREEAFPGSFRAAQELMTACLMVDNLVHCKPPQDSPLELWSWSSSVHSSRNLPQPVSRPDPRCAESHSAF